MFSAERKDGKNEMAQTKINSSQERVDEIKKIDEQGEEVILGGARKNEENKGKRCGCSGRIFPALSACFQEARAALKILTLNIKKNKIKAK